MQISNISLNVIPLKLQEKQKKFSFFKHKRERELVPVTKRELPEKYRHKYDRLYTNFSETKTSEVTFMVPFERSPLLAKHYLNHLMYNWFETKADLRKKDFIRNNEFYWEAERNEKTGTITYDRFVVRGTFRRMTDGFELTVMYRGRTQVWMRSVLEYTGSSRHFNRVVYNKKMYKYDELIRGRGVDRRRIFPVLNKKMKAELGISQKFSRVNKVRKHQKKIKWFYDTFIKGDENFRRKFRPAGDGFLPVHQDKLHRIPEDAADLLFGNGVVHKNPIEGMKKGGPYRPPAASHIELFIIAPEQNDITDKKRKAGNILYKDFKEGKASFAGLNQYAHIPIHTSKKHITYLNADNPLPEIRQKLDNMEFRDDVTYGAVYISTIHKDEPDFNKWRVYHCMKEELLKRDITSQVIDIQSVYDRNFGYYLPNIAVALIAKLGGQPWTLNNPGRNDLVIGVGAYKSNLHKKRYLGSAFCFSGKGEIRGLDAFEEDNHILLAGSFQKAVKKFRVENDGVDRLVIHFYKKMNKEETAVIKQALKELKLDIPVVVLTIHKTESEDLVLFNNAMHHGLPLSGTWMRSGEDQFLLCNNTFFGNPGDKIKSYPYPIKIYIDIAGEEEKKLKEHLDDPLWTGDLLKQVYQFSRLDWQTISIQHMPITVKYPEMVAQKFPFFNSKVLPEFGKYNFWFL
ncbi:MAG: Piwi domain-containing protein [Balneolaceae bacterium]